jgi:hypothetical protein
MGPEHLFVALLEQEGGIVKPILVKLGIDVEAVGGKVAVAASTGAGAAVPLPLAAPGLAWAANVGVGMAVGWAGVNSGIGSSPGSFAPQAVITNPRMQNSPTQRRHRRV